MTEQSAEPGLERYARQMQFAEFGAAGQRALLDARVVLIGAGALGTHIADSLVRAGVGHLVLVDRDFIELNNLQRQALYDEDDIAHNLPKAEAAARKLRRINSSVTIEPRVMDVNPTNVEALVAGADLVLDGTDNFATRYLVNDVCLKLGIPWVYGGVLASYGVTMTIVPGRTPCLRCLFPEMPAPGSTPTCDVAGILGPVVKIIGALEAAEALKLLAGKGTLNPGLLTIDIWDQHFDQVAVTVRVPSCPACGQQRYDYLEPASGPQATSLCGRNAIHIAMPGAGGLSLAQLAERLRPVVGPVAANEFMLRFRAEGYEFTVFPDARAIIKGTDDEALAKGLYARYIGS
ncbi:MAG TPA: ThiF family adenylyltransferase [Anaerolineae bacterium]|nr:ThiF family adenylyltransferase [Anaerolineae bacterium]HPL30695.1 ThiF family adenylyltransferase [Anaerolineae bacterium]